ncbi:RNA-binding cell elongation regulator Jag/EloR [Pseudodesulfovibrio tunisiensis]|uniref:RNA-binding cell elongation regulator Jag/EloR n=1 Tax=Pseudodesulfovibrio tunisiensis TaxID=463192 RepID=UPI001FB3D7FC|nr:RNA-binding cell elongation regulator Jag/EloR [Pseudodesulfovibrio tunisiensis]
MTDFKEFQGKNLDEAIDTACDYFNLKRDRLEIEIVGGGSTGIFGIVGVKKARIKARPRAQMRTADLMNGDSGPAEKKPRQERKPRQPKPEPAKEEARPEPQVRQQPEPEAQPEPEPKPVAEAPAAEPEIETPEPEVAPAQEPVREAPDAIQAEPAEEEKAGEAEDEVQAPMASALADLDRDELQETVRDVLTRILEPIVQSRPELEVTFDTDRVKVFIDDEENSGLIIGREGQTLSSIQYLVNRLVARRMGASVRVQVDTGDYRERQDEKLRQLAQHLADKALRMSRTQSTKPLSSYHRRIVHLALQDHESVFTRSKGDGPLKRVLIVPKRKNYNNGRGQQRH